MSGFRVFLFQGAQLVTIQKDNLEFAAIRPVVEGIGLDWASQSVRLNKNKDKFSCCDITTPEEWSVVLKLHTPQKNRYPEFLVSIKDGKEPHGCPGTTSQRI